MENLNPQSYKLEDLLSRYEKHISGDQTHPKFDEKKQKLADKVKNIMATGADQLNQNQVKALRDFSMRFSKDYGKDDVVKMASDLSVGILMGRQLGVIKKAKEQPSDIADGNADKDILSHIGKFTDVSSFSSLSKEMQARVARRAVDEIMVAGHNGEPLNYSDLTQFTKILTLSWDKPYIKNDKEKLVTQLLSLTENSPEKAAKFKELATTLIVRHDITKVPSAISDHKGFHGKALEQGIEMLQTALEKGTVGNTSLQDFTLNYCEDILKPGEYLIRNSSTVPSKDTEGIKYFTFTITWKLPGKEVTSTRLTLIEPEKGAPYLKDGQPPFKKDSLSYKSIDDYLEKMKTSKNANLRQLSRSKPAIPPKPQEVNNYVASKYSVVS